MGDRVYGVVDLSTCGMVNCGSWWSCQIVEWLNGGVVASCNGGMVELVELSSRLLVAL